MSTSGRGDHQPMRHVLDAHDAPVSRRIRACGSEPTTSVHSPLMTRIEGMRSAFPLRLTQAYEPERVARAHVAAPDTSLDPVRPSFVASPARSAGIDKLIGGRVDVPVSFSADPPTVARRAGSGFALHAQPADRNSAATGVSVGRMLDVTA